MRSYRPWVVAMIVLAASCGKSDEQRQQCFGKCDGELAGASGWIVDVDKARSGDLYGETSAYFFGLSMDELGLDAAGQALQVANQGATARLQQQGIQGVTARFDIVWDNLVNVEPAAPTLVFPFAPPPQLMSALPGYRVVITKKDETTGVAQYYAVKFKSGFAPLNIVPMLRDTSPQDQVHIKAAMNDGDVISYVHPEDTSMKDVMERRASHVAMHYECDAATCGKELVHHIDNPNGYGPQYNHRPNRHMPFHFFRYQPEGMEYSLAEKYAMAARNWAFITNDISPFAGFFDLQLQSFADLDRFVTPAVAGQEIPKLYCSGLAFANINLGINNPQNLAGLGPHYDTFLHNSWKFSDAVVDGQARVFTGQELKADQSLIPMGALVFEPYTASDMLSVWLENVFRGIPEEMGGEMVRNKLMIGVLNQQVPESPPGCSPDPFAIANRCQNKTAMGFAQAFSSLEWGGDTSSSMPVATIMNVELYILAKTLELAGQDGPQAVELIKQVAVSRSDGSQQQLGVVLDEYVRDMKITADELAAVQSPTGLVRLMEVKSVSNQFVPPRIWIDDAERTDGNMRYRGTVLNCELLAAADGSPADACAGGGLGAESYAEGGADTETYEHYKVLNHGQRTHRRISNAGPQRFGAGTHVKVRMTTPQASDVVFLLHVPANYDQYDAAVPRSEIDSDAGDASLLHQRNMSMGEYDRFCNQRNPTGETCAPAQGIVLDLSAARDVDGNPIEDGPLFNRELHFDLMSVCTIVDANWIECPIGQQQVVGNRTNVTNLGMQQISRMARPCAEGDAACSSSGAAVSNAFFVATMIDLGGPAAMNDTCEYGGRECCLECVNAGAHYNNYHIAIWDQAQ